MIEFSTVTREFRSLIHRNRTLMTFLGSLFVATSLVPQNVLKDTLPPSLRGLRDYVFVFYAGMVMVPTLILALRMAKMHSGMALMGILYARLMQEQTFTIKGDPQRSARHNFFGVSFLHFGLTTLFAAGAAVLLALSLGATAPLALGIGVGVFAVWLGWYFRFHQQATAFALSKAAQENCGPFTEKEWRDHVSSSMEDANLSQLSELGFVGLIMFSMLEKVTTLGEITQGQTNFLTVQDLQTKGPWVCAGLMLITCFFGLIVYIRLRVAIGVFSLQLDPTDKPFRPLRLTDSLLGYMLMAFLFVVSLHMTLAQIPELQGETTVLLILDGVAFALAVLVEQLTLVVAGRRYRSPVS